MKLARMAQKTRTGLNRGTHWDEVTQLRRLLGAKGVALVVADERGFHVTVQGEADVVNQLPVALFALARDVQLTLDRAGPGDYLPEASSEARRRRPFGGGQWDS